MIAIVRTDDEHLSRVACIVDLLVVLVVRVRARVTVGDLISLAYLISALPCVVSRGSKFLN